MRCCVPIERLTFLILIAVGISIVFPAFAAATSASISINGSEGALPLQASGTFTKHKFCNGDDCWYDNSGSLTVSQKHPNGGTYIMGSKSGNGSANWSTTLDTGAMAQGTYTFTATACDSKRICNSDSQSVTIDNTPVVTASAGRTEGDLDIKGTVDFKEHVGGSEGRVELYYIHPNGSRHFANRKYYEGSEPINWTWKDITGRIPDAGSWAQGKYTVQVIAIANNGASKQADLPVTIDNMPEVTASAGRTEGDLDIKGTVDFKEHVGGSEGRVELYYIHPNGSRHFANRKYYEGSEPINWTWKDITGRIPDAGSWAQGKYTVQVIAIANNGASKQADLPVTIDNMPVVNIIGPRCFADLTCDILGTVKFREYVGGSEGSVTLYLKDVSASGYSSYGSKSYEGTSINWKYADFTGARLSKATWGGRELMVQVVARAANGATATGWQYLMIPALGCPVPLR